MDLSQFYDEIGRSKVKKALQEVAQSLDSEDETLRPLFDRAYEIGFKPDECGTVELNTTVTLRDGTSVDGLIDTEAALTTEEKARLGIITPTEYLETLELERQIDEGLEADLEEEGHGPLDGLVTLASTRTPRYRWLGPTGGSQLSVVQSFLATHYMWQARTFNTSMRTIRTVQLEYMPPSRQARTYYSRSGGNARVWSAWRKGVGTNRSQNYRFDTNVYATAAQVRGNNYP